MGLLNFRQLKKENPHVDFIRLKGNFKNGYLGKRKLSFEGSTEAGDDAFFQDTKQYALVRGRNVYITKKKMRLI